MSLEVRDGVREGVREGEGGVVIAIRYRFEGRGIRGRSVSVLDLEASELE